MTACAATELERDSVLHDKLLRNKEKPELKIVWKSQVGNFSPAGLG